MQVAIIGAGIGSLTTALALHAVGIPCRIFERVQSLQPLGLGINLLSHATRDLCALGLDNELANVAVTTREMIHYDKFGNLIKRLP